MLLYNHPKLLEKHSFSLQCTSLLHLRLSILAIAMQQNIVMTITVAWTIDVDSVATIQNESQTLTGTGAAQKSHNWTKVVCSKSSIAYLSFSSLLANDVSQEMMPGVLDLVFMHPQLLT